MYASCAVATFSFIFSGRHFDSLHVHVGQRGEFDVKGFGTPA